MHEAKTRTTGDAHLAQRLESLGELASGIAHEINTPAQYVGDNVRFLQTEFANLLRLIDGYREVLANSDASDAERTSRIRALENETDFEFLRDEIPLALTQSLDGLQRVTRIVRAMKDFSHPGSTDIEPADLPNLITSTLEVCRNRWKYVAEVSTDFEAGLPLVPCSVSELSQVILNLVVNAADAISEKFGSDAPQRGHISVAVRRVGEQTELRVSDDGNGIAEEYKPRLFKQFFTTKPIGRGTGQGLALCRNVIVDRHNGSIDVESTAGVGTVFIIRLPLVQPAAVSPETL